MAIEGAATAIAAVAPDSVRMYQRYPDPFNVRFITTHPFFLAIQEIVLALTERREEERTQRCKEDEALSTGWRVEANSVTLLQS